MSTEQCRRLREAYQYARSRRTTKVIVLACGADFFSNGIHLNVIEAAPNQDLRHVRDDAGELERAGGGKLESRCPPTLRRSPSGA
jgi:enoyl-CoA hydratase/carnithine racemase